MNDSSSSNSTPSAARDWAEIQIAQTNKLYESLLDQHASLYRWLLAARLAANGGAAVAVAGVQDLAPQLKLVALVILSLGVVLSILAAALDQRALQKGISPNIAALGFWVKFKNDGNYDAEAWDRITEDSKQAAKSGMPGRMVGWLSLLTFVMGVAVPISNLVQPRIVCRVIEAGK